MRRRYDDPGYFDDVDEEDDDEPVNGLVLLMAAQSFGELRAALRDTDADELLTTPLPTLFEALRLYLPLRVRLEVLVAEQGVSTLGGLLESVELHRRINAQVPKGQVRRLVEGIAEWAATRLQPVARAAPPVRPPAAAPGPPPPMHPLDLERWAEQHGVLDCARASTQDLPDGVIPAQHAVYRSQYRPVSSVFQPAYREDRRADTVRSALWSWLRAEADAVTAARAAGRFRHPRPTDAVFGALHDRLSAAREPLDAPFPSRVRPTQIQISVLEDPLKVHARVRRHEAGPRGNMDFPVLELPLPATGPLELSCTCGKAPCAHRAMVLDVLMRVLGQPEDLFTSDLRRELTTPAWEKVLAFQLPTPRSVPPQPHALSFGVTLLQGRISVEVRAHRIGKKGPAATGKAVKPQKALQYPGLTAADRRVLEQLALFEPTNTYGYDREPSFLAGALLALAGHPRVVCADDEQPTSLPVTVATGRAGVRFEPTPAGLRPQLTVGGHDFDLDRAGALPHHEGQLLVCSLPRMLWLASIDEAALSLLTAMGRYQAAFPTEAHDALLRRLEHITSLEASLPPELAGAEVPFAPRVVVRVEPIGSEGLAASVRVRPAEGAEPMHPGEGLARAAFRRDGGRCFAVRDHAAEARLADALVQQLELEPDSSYRWELLDPARAIAVVDRLEGLSRMGLEVEWPAARWRLTRPAKTSDVKVQVTRKRDWFGLDGEVEVDGERVQLAVLLDSVRRRRRWVRLKERQWLRLSEDLVERLQGLSHVASEGEGGLEVTWAALPALESLQGELEQLEVAKDFAEMMTRVRAAGQLTPKAPKALKAELRDYQLQGFQWLSRLAAWGAGACLADDMGLGKTVQALALLVARAKEGPAMVVAPTSVIFNWREEAARFAPTLKVHEYRTADRGELMQKLGPGDVVLVSWGLLAQDAEALAARELATLVLDEAQAVKNASTLRAKAARGLKAGFKLALSGTPLENHLGELWSLYRVVLPGLFGSLEQFRARFATPIEQQKDEAARQALAAVVRPFLLRRNKSEVAKELPARTELTLHVELSAEERQLYDDARLAAVADLKQGEGDKRFQALAALTRLRQIACHPRLYDERWTGPASKLSRLMELLGDLKDGGHRALVFSQFTSHLSLVRDAVGAAGLSFQYLDGSTPAAGRQQRVEAFQRGEGDLFLISLKAGGMGLNLTAADYVVHLDPWWNPAVEDQATDRAHRIGQLKPVTVYRLIAQGTVEEGIVSLHADKRNLVAGVLDGTGAAGAMSTEELVRLIRGA